MYRAYIKDLDEFDYNDVPHKGHFVYGNFIKGNPNDDVDAIVGDLIEINDEYVNVEWWQSIEKGSAEQYTGLKDANGKEIYEGDIVVPVMIILGKVKRMAHPFEVRASHYVYEKWIATYVSDRGFGIDGWYTGHQMEVIGNIHENPELLEAQHG